MAETIKYQLLGLVVPHKEILLGGQRGAISNQKKQFLWKQIHNSLVSRRLVRQKRDWTWTRNLWYRFSHLAKKSLDKHLNGKNPYVSDFDKSVLRACGFVIESIFQDTDTEDESNIEDNNDAIIDLFEVTEHKVSTPYINTEPSDSFPIQDINILRRKIKEQKFKLQEFKLLKIKHEILVMKDKRAREAFMKLL